MKRSSLLLVTFCWMDYVEKMTLLLLFSGRFGFVEMRTEELATAAMQLDKVELCGRHINVGRPKGYVEPPSSAASQAKLGLAHIFAASLNCGPTTAVVMENLMLVDGVRKESARQEVSNIAGSGRGYHAQ